MWLVLWTSMLCGRRRHVLWSSSSLEESSTIAGAESEVASVVRRAAHALRDPENLVEACEAFKSLVSPANSAAKLSAPELAAAITEHRDVYGPLLEFESVAALSTKVDRDAATVVASLVSPTGALTDSVWSLSRTDAWRIDGVTVEAQKKDEFGSWSALASPKWVAKTVLDALRRVDEPDTNAGCDVALSFVSRDNPSSSLTREIFRSYLDDDDYPYGILTRWTEMRQDAEVLFDDDENPTTATVDITLLDDQFNNHAEWTVTLEMSKAEDRGWLIDRVWCHDY